VKWRNAPCGDYTPTHGYNWINDFIVRNPLNLTPLNLDQFPRSEDEIIDQDRIRHLVEKVRPHVSIHGKVYKNYEEKGFINYRNFLCPFVIEPNQVQKELNELHDELKSNTVVRSSVKSMSRKRIVSELIVRQDFNSAAN